MRRLKDQVNATPPSSDYPLGRLKDDPGDGTGVPVNEAVYGDIHQFFMRLAQLAGIKANGQPDNLYAGYQLMESLIKLFNVNSDGGSTRRKTSTVEIGDWDMDANTLKTVAHRVPDGNRIVRISIRVRDDTGNTWTTWEESWNASGGANVFGLYPRQHDITNVILTRLVGGMFDNTSYDSTSYNRGFVTCEYDEPLQELPAP